MAGGSDKQVHVQYYALLRDERGVGAETLRTGAVTVRELYDELRDRHGFSLGIDKLSLAVNDEFASWERRLDDKDQVVFIPPVAGG
jgi:molybdopterin converting factor small subunit